MNEEEILVWLEEGERRFVFFAITVFIYQLVSEGGVWKIPSQKIFLMKEIKDMCHVLTIIIRG